MKGTLETPNVLRAVERAKHHLKGHFAAIAERLGVTEVEAHVLGHLAHMGTPSISEVQEAFGLRPSTLTNILDRLAGRGLVSRETHPADRRSFVVVLTPAGKRMAARARRLVDELEATITARVSASQLAGFFAALESVERGLG
jgi:MarR family transcriptional regulator, organic hydroperoxide resistance regulator